MRQEYVLVVASIGAGLSEAGVLALVASVAAASACAVASVAGEPIELAHGCVQAAVEVSSASRLQGFDVAHQGLVLFGCQDLERPSLEMYCASKVRYDFCKAKCEQYGTVVKTPTGAWTYSPYYTQMRAEEKTCKGLLIEFGYTPSSRSRVSIAAKRKGQAETPFDDLKELGD